MAYDLPRTIARALDHFTNDPAEKSWFSRTAARFRFLELEPGFEQTADQVAGESAILGITSLLNRIGLRAARDQREPGFGSCEYISGGTHERLPASVV
jgi:hypothetical protein